VKLDERFRQKWAQADADGETIAIFDAWANDAKYLSKSGIGSTTRTVVSSGAAITQAGYDAALKRKKAWQRDLARVFQKVDFIATPTLQILPPRWHWYGSSVVREKLIFDAQNTVGINFSGNPALAIPIAMPAEKDFVPRTSLQLVGPNRSEAQLLNAGRLLSSKP
jgi:amidase